MYELNDSLKPECRAKMNILNIYELSELSTQNILNNHQNRMLIIEKIPVCMV